MGSHPRAPRRPRPDWAGSLKGAALALTVAVPTMLVEESWHGRPMIDQDGNLWVLALLVVVTAFVAGGAVAARRRPSRCLHQGAVAGVLAVGALLAAAAGRRLVVTGTGIQPPILAIWSLAAVFSVTLSLIGAFVSGRLAVEDDS